MVKRVDDFAETVGRNLPDVNKGIFGTRGKHAVDQGVDRGVFADVTTAERELKDLATSFKTNGFPQGTILDTTRPDSVLVPVGNNGYAVFRIQKNGTAQLRTTLVRRPE